jgi:hypothetical protein
MLERDRRPQLISLTDVVGVDALPPPLPPSQRVFAASGRLEPKFAVVYGASLRSSEELFVADFDAAPYHRGFFRRPRDAAEGVGEGLSSARVQHVVAVEEMVLERAPRPAARSRTLFPARRAYAQARCRRKAKGRVGRCSE